MDDLDVIVDPVQGVEDTKKKKKKKKKTKSGKKTVPQSSEGPASAASSGSLPTNIQPNGSVDEEEIPITTSLPIGKNTTQLPREYYLKQDPSRLVENPGNKFDFGKEVNRVYTSVPPLPCKPSLKDNPDGWTECIFDDPKLKKAVYSFDPNFPLPIPHPPKKMYRLVVSPTSGTGMVASTYTQVNDLIAAERPLLVCPADIRMSISIPYGQTATKAQMALISLVEQEKVLQVAFDRMLPKAQAAYKALANSHLEDGSGPLMGVMRTNGFGVRLEKNGLSYSAVYNELSRINHSCLPNAAVTFNKESFCGELRAIREIKAGEEIFVAYCTIDDPLPKRQHILHKYGFTCACDLCTSSTLKQFRHRVVSWSRKLISYVHDDMKPNDEEYHEKVLADCLGWVNQIEENRMQGLTVYTQYLEAVVKAYRTLGRTGHAALVTKKWTAIAQAMEGKEGLSHVLVALMPQEAIVQLMAMKLKEYEEELEEEDQA